MTDKIEPHATRRPFNPDVLQERDFPCGTARRPFTIAFGVGTVADAAHRPRAIWPRACPANTSHVSCHSPLVARGAAGRVKKTVVGRLLFHNLVRLDL